MKIINPCLLFLAGALLFAFEAFAQTSAISYQGRLTDGGLAANGNYDMQFKLFDTLNVGSGVQTGDLKTQLAVSVANRLFSVTLDFGAAVFDGGPRFLEISVKTAGAGGPYSTLSPRQQVASIPYAIRSLSAGTAATANALVTGAGVASLNNLKDNVTLAAGANITITPNGNSLTLASAGVGGSGIWSVLNNNAYYTAGNVGLGTDSPTPGIRLDVNGATLVRAGIGNIQFGSPNAELGMSLIPTVGDNRADLRFDGSILKLVASAGRTPPSALNGLAITTAGNVGIGSLTPQSKLEVAGQDALRLVGYQPFLTLLDANAGYVRSRIQAVNGEIVFEPESFINGSNPNSSVVVKNSGNVSLRSLTIRGGADVAEPFELSVENIAKGSVVVIDSDHPGKLKLSSRAYDTKVAGIVSGANGINPGISLYQQGTLEGGQNVALSGRVFVLADASSGIIEPGDLLTTSAIPGHAMKVSDHARSQGAILGKAMTALKDGQGLVLVLVTLQ